MNVGIGLALAAVAVFLVSWRWRAPAPEPDLVAATGTISVQSSPPGAVVTIDGRERGTTPLTLPLAAGTHQLSLQRGQVSRELTLSVAVGAQVVHHVEFAAPAASGRLRVTSTPAEAPVTFDGEPRGRTPIELADIAPGDHTVSVGEDENAVTQRVSVPAGETAVLVVPLVQRPVAPALGWVTVDCPVELQLFEGQEQVGSSRNGRILILAGRHTLRLSNPDLRFETTRTVEVRPGVVGTLRVAVPDGSLSVNAVPWAEVLLDGRRIGETPIANLAVPIGAHELVFRNPKFPEQRRSVTVTLASPLQVGVDLGR